MLTLPFTLPNAGKVAKGPDVDTGGYDFLLGGKGFRFATSTQFPYKRYTEPTTVRRFDTSAEPGEQTLSPLPWIKSQASFHGGAGQLNLEQGLSQFQYQQEEVSHVRFDTSLGIDPWTVGQVKRLPDVSIVSGITFTANPVRGFVASGQGPGGQEAVALSDGLNLWTVYWDANGNPQVATVNLNALVGPNTVSTIYSLTSSGTAWYVLLRDSGNIAWVITGGFPVGGAAPSALYKVSYGAGVSSSGTLGWAKQRLMGTVGNAIYELDVTASSAAAFPAAKYTYPVASATYTAISESPTGILVAALVGGQSTILQLVLDTAGATPTLTGGSTIGSLPPGEVIHSLDSYLGSFLGIGTTLGVRVGTFDTYSGALTYGPLSLLTTKPVYALAGRDRFIFAGYSDQQADGSTGLARIDLSMIVDTGKRHAWCPDLRPPTTAPTRKGTVWSLTALPVTGRLVWISDDGLHVEGVGAGSDGSAWIKTSRIRYDTAEPKLFTLARFHGDLTVGKFALTAYMPSITSDSLGTFGPLADSDAMVEVGLPAILSEWVQMQFELIGADAVLNSYQVKALPTPQRQHIIEFTAMCFREEVDRFNMTVTDPETPRTRYQNMRDMESNGNQIRFTEFSNEGPVSELVVIDQLAYTSDLPPNIQDDFGGYLSFKLRTIQ